AFPDVVTVAVLLLDAGLVEDAHAPPDTGVLVKDGAGDDRVFAHADGGRAPAGAAVQLVERLVIVRAEDEARAHLRPAADAAADADDRALDVRPHHDASLGEQAVGDDTALHLARGQEAGMCVHGPGRLVEVE